MRYITWKAGDRKLRGVQFTIFEKYEHLAIIVLRAKAALTLAQQQIPKVGLVLTILNYERRLHIYYYKFIPYYFHMNSK